MSTKGRTINELDFLSPRIRELGDLVTWEVDGFTCHARTNTLGAWLGYVAIPVGHPWHGQDYDEIDAEVHGGLTYSEATLHGLEPSDSWYVGFDCAHYCDAIPGLIPESEGVTFKDLGFVKAEIASLVKQAAEATR